MPAGTLDVNSISSIVTKFSESNNASISATIDTPGQGVFISPSKNVIGRPSDITGYFLIASTEEGKLEFNSGDGLLTLNELEDVTINNPIQGQYISFNGNKWVNEFIYNTSPWKESVRAATVANITLENLQTIDNVILEDGDRILVKDQNNPIQNGIYIVKDNTQWIRSTDFLSGSSASCDALCVEDGSINGGILFKCTNIPPNDIVDTHGLTFETFGSGGDVVGPLSSTNNSIARWDSVSGKILKDSIVSLTDIGGIDGATSITTTTGFSTIAGGAGGVVTLGGSGSSVVNITPFLGDTISFFGTSPVSQQFATGASGYIPVGGNTVSSEDTFTGGIGVTAYTIGDIVLVLKNLGLIAP